DIGQRLAACQLAMDRMKSKVHSNRTSAARELKELRTQTAAVSANVRRLSSELYSPALKLLGVGEAVADLCTDMAKKLRMEITFNAGGIPASVSADVSQCLY